VTPATAPLVVEPASVSAGMLPLLLLLLDRQVAPQRCKEEPPAQAGGSLFRTPMQAGIADHVWHLAELLA
jgi:hypothetical protein